MKGKWIFYGVAAFLGVLFALEGRIYLLFCFLSFLIFLWWVRKFSKIHLILIFFLYFLFFIKADTEDNLNKTQLIGTEKVFTIIFEHPLKIDGNLFTAYGKDNKTGERLSIQSRIATFQEKEKLLALELGSVCEVKGQLEKPQLPRNANAFNYKEYLRYEKIHWIFNASEIKIEECKIKSTPLTVIQNIRKTGIEYIESYFPPETAPLATALIFGDRNSIDPDLMIAYQRLGIVHLLAISGLHVGMLVGLLFYIGLRLQISREMMTNILIVFLPLYMILTGGSPSVIRACFMALLALILTKLNRNKLIPIDILSIVFISYVYLQPYVIYNIGFQLSFSVTFSLILSAPILSKYTSSPIYLLVITSLIAQFASTPILLYHFYEISLTSIFANIFFIPVFSLIILPSLLILLILHFIFRSSLNPLLSFLDFNLRILNDITTLISDFSFNTLVLGRPSNLYMILYLIGIPFFFYKWELARLKIQVLIAFIIPLSLIFSNFVFTKLNKEGEVTVIDVGQGDSILIHLPFGQGTYLIDTGGTMQFPSEKWEERQDPFEVGKDVLVPYLKSKGIRELDKLILTHGDMDHVGGARALLHSIKVKELVLPNVEEPSMLENEIINISKRKKIPIHFGQRGDHWKAGDGLFTIVSPSSSNNLERNDQSIVLYCEIAGLKWLFTGDIEEVGERSLISAYSTMKVDILKVGHHGSKTSTSEEFVNLLSPRYALISAGEDNRFGHPHQEVIERLEERKIKIFQTNKDGAISFYFQGKKGGTFSTQFHTINQKLN